MSKYNPEIWYRAITDYLRVKPKINLKNIIVLPKQEFDAKFNPIESRIVGKTAAITLPGNRIFIRQGHEDSGLHEMIHTAGFQFPGCEHSVVNEGMTQIATKEIGKTIGLTVRSGYDDEVRIASDIIKASGMPKQRFLQGYARAKDKIGYVTNQLWNRHKNKFKNESDWGPTDIAKKGFYKELKNLIGYSTYLDQIFNER